MTDSQQIRAVVFDLGDTLWFLARHPPLDEVWLRQAEAVAPLLARWQIELPLALPSLLEQIWLAGDEADRVRENNHLRETDLAFIARGAFASHGIDITPEQAQEWHRRAWIPVRHFGVQLYPDTIDVLCELHSRGIRLAINSNRPCTGDMLAPDLHDMGIDAYIEAGICSGDTGFVKPHPSTFLLALEKLALPAKAVVMVGDSCARDCTPARELGMTTVLKLNGRYDEKRCDSADYSIHDLAELLALPIFDFRHAQPAESLTPHEDGNEDRY